MAALELALNAKADLDELAELRLALGGKADGGALEQLQVRARVEGLWSPVEPGGHCGACGFEGRWCGVQCVVFCGVAEPRRLVLVAAWARCGWCGVVAMDLWHMTA